MDSLPGAKMVPASALLIDTLHALNNAVRYCVLRGADEEAAGSPQPDVDLLVAPRDLPKLERIASSLGFVPLASWGHGGHRFFVAYEEGSGHWLKLDVVTRLRYGGANRLLAPRALAGCLDRRTLLNSIWRPEVADALLGLMLHAVLDKGAFREGHRRELGRLRGLVEADDAMQTVAWKRFREALGTALPWGQASDAIVQGAWESLVARRRQIAWELFWRAPLGCVRRWVMGVVARTVRPLLVALGHRGLSVALLGPSRAATRPLALALAQDPQIRARIFHVGSSMRLVEQVWRHLVTHAWRLRGRTVVFEDYPHDISAGESGSRMLRWVLSTATMRPDLRLLLGAPPEGPDTMGTEPATVPLEWHGAHQRGRQAVGGDFFALDSSCPEEETIRRAKFLIWNRYRERCGWGGMSMGERP